MGSAAWGCSRELTRNGERWLEERERTARARNWKRPSGKSLARAMANANGRAAARKKLSGTWKRGTTETIEQRCRGKAEEVLQAKRIQLEDPQIVTVQRTFN